MKAQLHPLAVAHQPTQQRARQRFDLIVAEAERLLLESGLSGFSIPALAERLGYTRGSIYAYFPTHYALLNELVRRYLVELEALFFARARELQQPPWERSVERVVDYAIDFYNANPVARLLILGGAATDESYRTQEMTIKHLGNLARDMWASAGIVLPPGPPDITTLATEIGTACFRRSVFEHGSIIAPYRDAAVRAMTGFLRQYIEPARATRQAHKISA